ncbi:MAG TPA: RsmE family RNA methyltransferase [Opitutaceae bacterium]|nr:RsmE family RNA methyltransferase [Opitutaceae bacterium]
MPDFRVFCQEPLPNADRIVLSPEESHHLVTVNRARVGDPVVAFDGKGSEWVTRLTKADKRAAELAVATVKKASKRLCQVTLAQALPKGTAFDAIVKKGTELGVACIAPLNTERTQVHLEGGRQDKKNEKWITAAMEAAKQCGNPWLPEIGPLSDVKPFIEKSNHLDEAVPALRLIASLYPGAVTVKTALAGYRKQHQQLPREIIWLIGPEGDFTKDELDHALAHHFVPVTLGPQVLRCETAAVYAVSVIMHEMQG